LFVELFDDEFKDLRLECHVCRFLAVMQPESLNFASLNAIPKPNFRIPSKKPQTP